MDQPNTPIKVNYKENLRIILALFLPSALGLIIYSMFFLTIIVFEQNSEFKKLLQTISVNNFKGTFLDGTINSISKLLSTKLANTITLYLFWAIIAAIIYFIGSRLYNNFYDINRNVKLRTYVFPEGTDKNGPIRRSIQKIMIRLGALILLLIYVFRIVPFSLNLLKTHDLKIHMNQSCIINISATLILTFVFLHFGVILVRILLFRRRIVGS